MVNIFLLYSLTFCHRFSCQIRRQRSSQFPGYIVRYLKNFPKELVVARPFNLQYPVLLYYTCVSGRHWKGKPSVWFSVRLLSGHSTDLFVCQSPTVLNGADVYSGSQLTVVFTGQMQKKCQESNWSPENGFIRKVTFDEKGKREN